LHAGETLASPPVDLQVELTRIDPNGNFLRSAYAVESAIEYLVYDVLEANHSGWEINDGSYGEFRFDVANGTITVARNERLTSIYSHESLCRSRAVGHSYHHALSSIKKWGGSADWQCRKPDEPRPRANAGGIPLRQPRREGHPLTMSGTTGPTFTAVI